MKLTEKVIVKRLEKDKGYKTITTIPAGDMVMLVNMYKYVKENDTTERLYQSKREKYRTGNFNLNL